MWICKRERRGRKKAYLFEVLGCLDIIRQVEILQVRRMIRCLIFAYMLKMNVMNRNEVMGR
uniref:Uncharacterized protein n=1 Tax=Ascaris lumbricoides TaxID=6252 RepID=A0A0M3I3H0_ASCLU